MQLTTESYDLLQVQQLEAELSQLRGFGSGDRGPEVSQQKLQQLRVQLADAETRAASHFVILQQHQQRKDSQERKAAALQVGPCTLHSRRLSLLLFVFAFISFDLIGWLSRTRADASMLCHAPNLAQWYSDIGLRL